MADWSRESSAIGRMAANCDRDPAKVLQSVVVRPIVADWSRENSAI